PDLAKRVDLLISVVGFAHHEDFVFKSSNKRLFRIFARFWAARLPAVFFRNVCLHPSLLRLVYAKTPNAKEKFKDKDSKAFDETMDFEVQLWHANDVRTHWATTAEFLQLNNCQKRIDLSVYHISVKQDRYFDNHLVEQHMRVIFND